MEEKTIDVDAWEIRRASHGAMFLRVKGQPPMFVGAATGSAPKIARAILELCEEGPKDEPKGGDCYIAVTNSDDEYSWARGGEIVDGLTDSGKSQEDAIAFIVKTGVTDKEFHIFRRVATVGPIPQPERKVTRYE